MYTSEPLTNYDRATLYQAKPQESKVHEELLYAQVKGEKWVYNRLPEIVAAALEGSFHEVDPELWAKERHANLLNQTS